MKKKRTDCYSNRPYERTEIGMCYRIYYDQVRSSRTRGHNPPPYTKEKLRDWIQSQPNFNKLYNAWVESNFTTDFRPSCDRLDNTKGYSFCNMELVTFKVNTERANRDTIKGILGSSQVEVYQYTLEGSFKAKYHSMSMAANSEKGLDQRNISSCCRGKINSAYGYQWFYTYQGETVPKIELDQSFDREIYKYCAYTGDIKDIFPNLTSITNSPNKKAKIRDAINTLKHHDFHYYSFEYLSPEQLLKKHGRPKQKHIRAYAQSSKELIAEFTSANKAHKGTGLADTTITQYCKNKLPIKGFLFRYTYEDELHNAKFLD